MQSESKRIVLISPTIHKPGIARIAPFWLPPLALASVAAITPPEYDVRIVDENVEDIDFEMEVDLVALSFLSSQTARAFRIADEFQSRAVPVVMGGFHPSAMPDECAQHADSVVVGEAELHWERVLADFENGSLKRIYREEGFVSLDNASPARRDLLKKDMYLSVNTVQTSRGCPYACEFCNISTFFGKKYRTKPISSVVEDIRSAAPGKGDLFFFVDDEITANPKRAEALFRALVPLNIRWWSQATMRNLTRNPDLLKLARESGCEIMVVGLETLSPSTLKRMGKHHNTVQEFEKQIRTIQDAGITLNPSFTFGHDGEGLEALYEAGEFLKRNAVALATFNILTPLPGTRLFERLENESRILTRDWSLYDMGHCVYQPERVSPEELEHAFQELSRDFYSVESIRKRMAYVPAEKRNLLYGWNLGYKRLLDTFGVLM